MPLCEVVAHMVQVWNLDDGVSHKQLPPEV